MSFMSSIRTFLLLSVLIIALAIGCGSSIDIKHDYDRGRDFSTLKVYDWFQEPTIIPGNARTAMVRSGLVVKRIRDAVDSQLSAKGLMKDSSNPSFLIIKHLGLDDKINVTDWGYSYGSYGRYYGGAWGGRTIDVYQYTEGTLILDFIDPRTKELIWRGVATGTVDRDRPREEREKRLNEAIAKILAKFPPVPST